MKKKIFCLTTIIAFMFITFMCKPAEAAYESAPVNNLIKKGVEFYNSNNEKITTLQMNNGDTETITAKIKFEYTAPSEGIVSNMPIRYYISSPSSNLELIPAENGELNGEAILGYNTDYEVIYDGGNHTDCYVYQTFQVKANANVSDVIIGFFVDVNIEGIEYSEGVYHLPVFVIEPENIVDYTVDGEDGNSISFVNEEGKAFYFESFDYTAVTDEYIQEIVDNSDGIYTFEELKDLLDFILENAENAVNGKGDIIKVFEFNLYDAGVEVHNAPNGFKIRIKISDDMKGYDTYSLFYINYDGTTEDAIELTKNGDYLEGTLPHLSTYALVGNNNETSNSEETATEPETTEPETVEQDNTPVEETTEESTKVSKTISNSPKTGDNITTWISLVAVSTSVAAGLFVYTRKN